MGRLALLSVSDKTGLLDLARQLVENFDFEIISSGGTAQALQAAGIPVIKVSDYTGSPEILGGRVKTLHPRIHGGILARPDLNTDRQDLEAQGIRPLDLVVVNLYPFAQTIAQEDITPTQAIEQIDIGGPAMLRAAAKNFNYVTVLCAPQYYPTYLEELRQNQGATSLGFRQEMAAATFALTQAYDRTIAAYLNPSAYPEQYGFGGSKLQTLRYGENPDQSAAWYQTGIEPTGWASATKLQGKELSYNNLIDLEAARRLIAEFPSSRPAAAILKHTNPCGVALGTSLHDAYQKALAADPISAFGGIVALNQPIDEATAHALTETFLECVVAPDCTLEAKAILTAKSKVRILLLNDLVSGPQQLIKAIAGGFLLQAPDDTPDDPNTWQIASQKHPSSAQLEELLFAWRVVKHVKSNAIVVTNYLSTLGIGAGQMNRVGSVKIALEAARERASGAYLASDGFFPFDDSVRTAAAAGIGAIIQPGGSVKDKDSIQAADELGLVLVITGKRHFLH
jgi:phosphoribosylaminoimidazolecarboxamide formyltransferase/IMP cyclohydrolase